MPITLNVFLAVSFVFLPSTTALGSEVYIVSVVAPVEAVSAGSVTEISEEEARLPVQLKITGAALFNTEIIFTALREALPLLRNVTTGLKLPQEVAVGEMI